MDKYKKYFGVIIFCVLIVIFALIAFNLVVPQYNKSESLNQQVAAKQQEVDKLRGDMKIVQDKIKRIKDSIVSSQKKIYSPIESDLGNETLFFTLYNDVIEMLHANSIKIRSIDYEYNPQADSFVKAGNDIYFVCDVKMELISNYVNLGKLIQDIYQYPYYIRINEVDVKPYAKDKKILISNLSLRLYAHTAPDDTATAVPSEAPAAPALDGAATALPQ